MTQRTEQDLFFIATESLNSFFAGIDLYFRWNWFLIVELVTKRILTLNTLSTTPNDTWNPRSIRNEFPVCLCVINYSKKTFRHRIFKLNIIPKWLLKYLLFVFTNPYLFRVVQFDKRKEYKTSEL